MSDATTPAGEEPEIKVLMVDDQAMVCEAVRRMLEGEKGIAFYSLNNPAKAIETALEIKPTVILQDLVMPEVDGLTLVKFFRAKAETKNVPMIVLSSKEEPETKKKAFELGANDYLVKLPDKLEVIARVRYHSQGYLNLLQREKAEAALQAELDEAARYVRSLFPDPMENDIAVTDWVFISSSDLAGDTFGYHDLDEDHFAIYLLDVTGHGVGAALHSVSAINVLRAQSLPGVDFKDPGAVLSGLNEAFDMDKHNQMYFTLWYGVFQRSTRELKYSSGGHPPAMLINDPAKPKESLVQLATPGMVIGGMPGAPFSTDQVSIPHGSKLYVFSDGVYEIDYKDGSGMMTEEEFGDGLCMPPIEGKSKVESMVQWVREAQGRDAFEDDYSLMEIVFK
ncbi:MAG: SpoIIE family protein phosphatase [Verrucomicrobiota bacterium]